MQALSDFRVLDLTQLIAGPYATKLLADYGADVIKVERPGGEPGRWLWPFKDDVPGLERSGMFAYLNTNKRGIVLDLKSDDDRRRFLRLVETADALVESFSPGTLDRLGIGLEVLRQHNPRLSLISISNFGQTGPYRDWQLTDLVLYAMAGEMYSTGLADREPLKMAGSTTLIEAGATAAVAIAGTLFGTRCGLPAQEVDVALFETQLCGADRRPATVLAYQFSGRIQERPARAPHETGFTGGVQQSADGYIDLSYRAQNIEAVRRLLGNPPELADPEFARPISPMMPAFREAIEVTFLPWLRAHGKREIWAILQANGIVCGPINSVEEFFMDPVTRERGFFVPAESPELGRYDLPGAPFRMPEAHWALQRTAPELGRDTQAVLQEAVIA